MLLEKIERENFNSRNLPLAKGHFEVNNRKFQISIGETRYCGCHWVDVEDILPNGSFGGSCGSWDHTIYEEAVDGCVPQAIANAMEDVMIGLISINQLGEILYNVLPNWFESKTFYL